ncbi:MAG TPA: hypothetical protein VE053_16305 [Allosphingosinicella sp.]|nr:hypothetical protein [Allosphingosinicella sp.]
MSVEQPIVAARADRTRRYAVAAIVFAMAVLALDAARLFAAGDAAVRFPWELDYGEGIVWEQMRLMLSGQGYGSIDGLPAIVFHYPPVFHMATAALAGATGLDPLAAGRLVSLLSTLLTGVFAGLIAAKTVRAESSAAVAALSGAVGGLAVFSLWPVVHWAPLMRVDMLATALSFAGVYAAMLALKRPPLILLAAACFVAAVYTKQTSIVAPGAVFLTFLVVRPRLAWACAGFCIVLGLAALGALAWATDGGFIRHIFLYNVNRFEAWRLLLFKDVVLGHIFYFAVLAIGLAARLKARLPFYRGCGNVAGLRERLASAPADALLLLVLVYALLAGLMTLSVAKSGSNVNYFIEWMAVLAILLGIFVRDAAAAAAGAVSGAGSRRLFAQPALMPLLIGLQALTLASPPARTEARAQSRVAELEQLSLMVREADRPIISDDMVLLRRSGVPVQWEPAIFAELASTGAWDERGFVERVRSGQFAFFVTAGTRGQRLFDSRYNPAVADAISAAYPVRRKLAGFTIHLPAGAVK